MHRIFELIECVQTYNPDADVELINRAYVFAVKAHANQKRRSGEMYIVHPIAVAGILAHLKMDVPSIVTALLHDTVEDTHITLEMISATFGAEVARLVNALTKIGQIHFSSQEEKQAENFRKMIMATAEDVRVLVIKLADRLHNMQTLNFMSEQKRRSISLETMQIYAPLAHRLGIHWLKQDLDDLAFAYLAPDEFASLSEKMLQKQQFLEHTCEKLGKTLEKALQRHKVKASVEGRTKHVYSLYEKMQRKHVSFDGIYDLVAFRVIVDDPQACYHVLGMMHALYRPVPGAFKDYIALPKPNGYQSLHTAVMGPDNHRIEIQIRTQAMHEYANFGVAAHWLYKGDSSVVKDGKYQLPWLNNLTKLFEGSANPDELMEDVRMDLFLKEVYVFSRDGDIFSLPKGASPLDFAYAVHSNVGNHCIGVRVNGEQTSLGAMLRNGDQIEVLTDADQSPSRSWIKYVKTSRARQAIRLWMRQQDREINIQIGKRMLAEHYQCSGVDDAVLAQVSCVSWDDFCERVGQGQITHQQLETWLGKPLAIAPESHEVDIKAASCCRPIPGDRVVARVKAGLGLEAHYCRCPVIAAMDQDVRNHSEQWREVRWKEDATRAYLTAIECVNRNKQGMLSAISGAIADEGANIDDVRVEQSPGGVTVVRFLIAVQSRAHLAKVMRHVSSIEDVIRVRRCFMDEPSTLGGGSHSNPRLRAVIQNHIEKE